MVKGVHLIHKRQGEVEYSTLKNLEKRCRTTDEYLRVVAWVLKRVNQFSVKIYISEVKTTPDAK